MRRNGIKQRTARTTSDVVVEKIESPIKEQEEKEGQGEQGQ